ncbi:Helitron helicase [Phytophthora megakarya]|uniref:Helitron helicase n=1 Tax=Phytophthora megakarya TaxID=4795 RepID=A0A225W443_9STRA|nr:Helitron helicase [Phytophthora megakarya]
MVDGKCSKGYPKPLVEVTRPNATRANVDGYPEVQRCRRPPGKLEFKNREYDNATANQWAVPYNSYLSQKYNCHINIEICTGITVVKYMYKYMY